MCASVENIHHRYSSIDEFGLSRRRVVNLWRWQQLLAAASETPNMALAPRYDLVEVPSSSSWSHQGSIVQKHLTFEFFAIKSIDVAHSFQYAFALEPFWVVISKLNRLMLAVEAPEGT